MIKYVVEKTSLRIKVQLYHTSSYKAFHHYTILNFSFAHSNAMEGQQQAQLKTNGLGIHSPLVP